MSTFLPPVIQQLLHVTPTALLAQNYAKNVAKYYRDYYQAERLGRPLPATPQVGNNHHFHIVIFDDPSFSVCHPIPHFRGVKIMSDIHQWVGNTGTITTDPDYIQIQNAKIDHFTFNITLCNPTFAAFVTKDQPYLIDARRNTIIFNNRLTADALFMPTEAELSAEGIPMPPHEDTIPLNTSDDEEDVFFDALDFIDDTSPAIQAKSHKKPASTREKEKSPLNPQKTHQKPKKQTAPAKENHTSHNEIALDVDDHEKPIETTSMFSGKYWSTYFASLKPKKTSKPLRFLHYKPAMSAPMLISPPMKTSDDSPRFTFLKKQFNKKDHISNDPDVWLEEHIRWIAPWLKNSTRFKEDFKKDIIGAKKSIQQTICDRNPEISSFISSVNDMDNVGYFSIPASAAITYRAYDPEQRTLNLFFPLVVWSMTAVIFITQQAQKINRREYEKTLLKRCLDAQYGLLNASDAVILALNLITLNELKAKDVDLMEVIKIETKRGQSLYNLQTLIYKNTHTDEQTAISLDTVLCLVSIHGRKLFDLMNEDNVPEINIPFMRIGEQEKLFQEKIELLQTKIPAQNYLQIHFSIEQRSDMRDIMDSMLLVYALRNKTEHSAYFEQFDKDHEAFVKHINEQINAFTQDEPSSIHQYATKSRLFTCALIEEPGLAIGLLEHLSNAPGPKKKLQC
ncbi:MAG: hypothetical protein ACHQAX_07010 [Gammaproteobacteria bacterium]